MNQSIQQQFRSLFLIGGMSLLAAPHGLTADTAQGIGLDGAFYQTDFGAARSLSGDGSTAYF